MPQLRDERQAEPDAAGRLFAAHSDCILGYCARQLGSRSEAEDAMQITFLYALRALQRDVVPESESAWLHAIAKNVCRWQQRSASRRCPISEVDLDSLTDSHPARPDEDGALLGLREALASIPDNQRQAIVLREWHGLSGAEIASRLELSEPAAHALLTRARRSLANALTSLPRRPVFGFNIGPLLFKCKTLLVGGSANIVATTTAVATLVVVGAGAVERTHIEHQSSLQPVSKSAAVAQEETSKPKTQAATASQQHMDAAPMAPTPEVRPPSTKTPPSSRVTPEQRAANVPAATAAPTVVANPTPVLANAQATPKLPRDLPAPALTSTLPPLPDQSQPLNVDANLPLDLPPSPLPPSVNPPDLAPPPQLP